MEKVNCTHQMVSAFLKGKLERIKQENGERSGEYIALASQYIFDPEENKLDYKAERRRHYEAELKRDEKGKGLKGVERLYRRTAVLELTTSCVSRCRWCLRANYAPFTLSKAEAVQAAKYFGNKTNRTDLTEILITGGDPLIVPDLLDYAVDSIRKYAPNIKIIRIGSRLPVQEPKLVYSDKLKYALRRREGIRFELGTQINHPIELFPESREAYLYLQEAGMRIYNQQVLLKGVNDNLDTLVELHNLMREVGIEPHYLFHCVPIRGMSHHRTTIGKGMELISGLTASGRISGRSKPKYTAMTDIGKITFYEGVILDKRGDMVLLQSRYKLEERLKWNPGWRIPGSAEVDDAGYLRVWYKDAEVHSEGWPVSYLFKD